MKSIKISTHTLTWSVTICGEQNAQTHNISTHTLTWSVTLLILSIALSSRISTHTLTWSVTLSPSTTLIEVEDFNSHAHVERDPMNRIQYEGEKQISTHTLTWSVT